MRALTSCRAPFSPDCGGNLNLRSSRIPSKARVRPSVVHRLCTKVQAGNEGSFEGAPWELLEVPIDADEKTIKKAYRHLALRNHPDINSSPDAPFKFQKISQAYEMLMDRKRGKDYVKQKSHRRHSEWSFHDWYWDFMLQQRHKAQGKPPKAKPVLQDGHLHGQLAGLRKRAAGRRQKTPRAESVPSSDRSGTGESSGDQDVQHSATQNPDLSSSDASETSYAFAHGMEHSDEGLWSAVSSSEHSSSEGSTTGYSHHLNHSPLGNQAEPHGDDSSLPLQDESPGSRREEPFRDTAPPENNRSEVVNDDIGISRQLQGLKRRAAKRKDL